MAKHNLEFLNGDYSPLNANASAKITFLPHRAEVITTQTSAGATGLSGIKKLTKYSYVNIYTGEVSEYAVNSNKIDNTTSIKQSLKRLRLLIMNNFIEFESFLITLTYSSEMTNFEQAADDYRKFYDNLKYHYKEYKFEYIRIIEPTGNGIWHIHILIKSAVYVEKFFIQQSVVQNLWKHGSVQIRQIYDTTSLAAYFCTYSNNENVKAKRKPKHLIKQSRWKYYPRNAKIYTKSRGIKAPDCIQTTRGEVDSILAGYARVSANSLIVKDRDTDTILNKVNYEHFERS